MDSPSASPVLRIGDAVPDFEARSTTGPLAMRDYRGRWLVMFSHPADFTPVCTSEFVGFARAAERFAALDCALMALSVDSLYAHLAWVRAIDSLFGVEVRFPIIEDPSMAIGRAYGMIDDVSADSTAMRASFFIDPDGIIRAINWYPHNVGRSVEEMLRILKALQTVSTKAVLTPEGWHEGEPLLLPPADTLTGEADWFCRLAQNP